MRTTYQSYFKLNINERINVRQHRNSLNINWLFSTTIATYHLGEDRTQTERPKVNNGLYHHVGKNHSKYPKN